MDEFVAAVQEVFPGCCMHFEDWQGTGAMRLLGCYRDQVSRCSDDIQGTAGVTLAGLLSALRVTGGNLADQRVLFLGAGVGPDRDRQPVGLRDDYRRAE